MCKSSKLSICHAWLIVLLLLPASQLTARKYQFEEGDHNHPHPVEVVTADDVYNSRVRSDLSYKQVMEMLVTGSSLIHKGILHQNSIMVNKGADLISEHYSPYHEPWIIFAKKDQEAFKKMLIAYNDILHESANAISLLAEEKKWQDAAKQASNLTSTCISCHTAWKDKVVAYPKTPIVRDE